MQLICLVAIIFLFSFLSLLGVILSPVRTQLLYTDPSKDDGPCKFPSPVPLLSANVKVNPSKSYYVPVASENFYRFAYNMATNKSAQTEDEVVSLQMRMHLKWVNLFKQLWPIAVTFFGGYDVHYLYGFDPSTNPSSLPNPLFDFNVTAFHGGNGSAPTGFAGEIILTIIWNDESPAFNIYTCIGGRQMFHIVSAEPTLTNEQFEVNKKLLMDLGMSPDNFQYLKYGH